MSIVYVGTHDNPTCEAAKVILPGHTVFEKNGTFINQQFRIQKFQAAIPGLAGTTNDLVILSKLFAGVAGTAFPSDLAGVWAQISMEVASLTGVTFANLPEEGLVINSTDFANLPFCEGETLHFKPAVKAAAPAAV